MSTRLHPGAMRVLVALSLVGLSVALAGCATNPSPVGDAEAAHAGVTCPAGTFVSAFTSAGSPQCIAAVGSFSCPPGEVMTGYDAVTGFTCTNVMEVAIASDQMDRDEHTPPTPAKSLSLASAGALHDGVKTYTIAAASRDMTWSDVGITVQGVMRQLDADGECPRTPSAETVYLACSGSTMEAPSDTIQAGDTITLSGLEAGTTLRILDAQANSVLMTITVA